MTLLVRSSTNIDGPPASKSIAISQQVVFDRNAYDCLTHFCFYVLSADLDTFVLFVGTVQQFSVNKSI